MNNLVKTVVEWDIADLIPDPANENKHSDEDIAVQAKRIRRAGWYSPILADKNTKMIVAGHKRWEAAKLLHLSKVPVVFKDYPNERERELDRVADNMTSRESTLLMPEIANTIIKYDDGTLESSDWGMKIDSLNELMLKAPLEEIAGEPESKELMTCPKCGHMF